MEVILKTQKKETILTTIYEPMNQEFKTIYLHEGTARVLEKFKNPNDVIETHDFWCKIVGLIQQPFSKLEVQKHIGNLDIA